MTATDKVFLRADDVVRDSFALAKAVYDSGFVPDLVLVLWRGGTPVGIVLHEFLLYKGISTDHAVVKAVSYTGIGERGEPRLEGMEYVLKRLTDKTRVLVVDDIFDTGCTLQKVYEEILPYTDHIRLATLYYKTGAGLSDLVPDYYWRKTDRWIVFPHELEGLTDEEIKAKDSYIYDLLNPNAG